jgi:hypothetical protein
MSQAATLRAFDAAAAAAFGEAGMADAGTYTPPGGGTPVDCTVLVDREQQDFADGIEPVSGQRVAVTLFLAEVEDPEQDGLVVVGSESWVLYREIARDESRAQWVVRP